MSWNLTTITLLVPLFFLLTGLAVTVLMDPYISRRHRIVMGIIIVLSVTLIAQNLLEDRLAAGEPQWFLRTAVSVYGYTLRPVFLVLFLYIVEPEKKHLPCWGLIIFNGLLHLTAFFSTLVFHIDEYNHYQGGPLHSLGMVVSMILLGIWLVKSLWNYRSLRKRDMVIPVLVVVIVLVSIWLDRSVGYTEQPITLLTFSTVICSVLYYIWLHLRFVREHEDDLKARQRIQIMLSQIQPHFLYNALGAVGNLCDDNPEAQKAIFNFSSFLQGNMYSLSETQPIPFSTEMEHTKAYLELEKLRFGKKLNVVYDLAATEFLIPTLTLQPIVENAVRHGVRYNKSGEGTVTISSRECGDHWEITVSDDGPGFDPARIGSDQRPHIGLQNVQERMRSVAGGDLRIDSAPGQGCRVTIELPKEDESHVDLRH